MLRAFFICKYDEEMKTIEIFDEWDELVEEWEVAQDEFQPMGPFKWMYYGEEFILFVEQE